MSWTHSSKTAVAAALVVVLFGAVGTAAALQFSSSGVPNEAQVGSDVSATVTISDPYTGDVSSKWDLRLTTELENVGWTIEESFQGETQGENESGAQSFVQTLPVEAGSQGDKVTIEVSGTVPAVGNYSYEPRQNFTIVKLEQVQGNNVRTLETYTVEYYTAESKNASQAIKEARQAIEDVGGNEEASNRLQQAISAYESENFENAVAIASDAKEIAEESQQSQQTMQLVLFAVVGIVVVGLVAGGIWYWRSQQGPSDKLR